MGLIGIMALMKELPGRNNNLQLSLISEPLIVSKFIPWAHRARKPKRFPRTTELNRLLLVGWEAITIFSNKSGAKDDPTCLLIQTGL